MDTDIHKSAEVGHVGHHAFQHHVHFQIFQLFHAFSKARGFEFRARITAGFFQLGQNVFHCRQAELFIGKFSRIELLDKRRIADQRAHLLLHFRQNLFDHRIGFRVHRRGIERIIAIADTQETRRLLEGLVAQTRHFQDVFAVLESTIGIAIADNIRRQRRRQAGNPRQQGCGGHVYIHADRIHAIFDHGIEHARELRLVHIVLILPHTNGFRVDLDEFRQRVLQTTGNRHRAANTDIQIGEFPGSQFRRRIHRGACFRNHQFLHRKFRAKLDEFNRQFVGFAAGGAVANRYQFHLVFRA